MDEQRAARYTVDLNCDIGESFGIYRIPGEEALLELATSANVACGFHAGDPGVMRRTVRLCLDKGIAIGAHPGFPDREGFGRRELAVTPEEAYELTLYQLGALGAFLRAEGGTMRHVKPHGALYHLASRSLAHAEAVSEAVLRYDASLVIVGPAGSRLLEAGAARGLRVAREAFADRSYEPDGGLTPRGIPGAVLHDPAAVAAQLMRLLAEGVVRSASGGDVRLGVPDTVCLHGDTAGPMIGELRRLVSEAGIELRAIFHFV